jgi:hypothetical protein
LVALALLLSGCSNVGTTPSPVLSPTPIASPTPISWPWHTPMFSPGYSCPTYEKGSPPPSGIGGWQQPRDLTEEEKARVVQIALNSPEASDWLQGRTDYQVSPVDLYAIEWHDGKFGGWVMFEYPIVCDGIPCCVSPYAYWYPGVSIHAVEQGIIFVMQIVVDLDSGKTVKVLGPLPPP